MIDGLNDVVEQLAGLDIESMPDAAVRAEYIELMRARDRIDHCTTRLLVAIHGRGIPFENACVIDAGVGAVADRTAARRGTRLARYRIGVGNAAVDREGVGAR